MVPLANCVYHVSVVLEESWFLWAKIFFLVDTLGLNSIKSLSLYVFNSSMVEMCFTVSKILLILAVKFNFIKFWEFSKANDKGASVRAMADAPFFLR